MPTCTSTQANVLSATKPQPSSRPSVELTPETIPVSSTKSMIGQSAGAAGRHWKAFAAVMAIRAQPWCLRTIKLQQSRSGL